MNWGKVEITQFDIWIFSKSEIGVLIFFQKM